MAFRVLFLAHAPDADKDRHRTIIDTGMYRLITAVVKDQQDAVEVCCEIVEKESIDSIMLCPGFTHSDVAEIKRAAGPAVGQGIVGGENESRVSRQGIRQVARRLASRMAWSAGANWN